MPISKPCDCDACWECEERAKRIKLEMQLNGINYRMINLLRGRSSVQTQEVMKAWKGNNDSGT